MNTRRLSLIFLMLFFISLVVYITSSNPTSDFLTTIFYVLPSFIVTLLAFKTAFLYGKKSYFGKAMYYLFMGFLLFFIGDLLWDVLLAVYDYDVYPSFVDIVYLSAYPFLYTGFIIIWKNSKVNISANYKKYFYSISALLILLVSYLLIYQAYDGSNPFLENIFGILYGLADLVLIIANIYLILIALEFRKGKYYFTYLFILIGFILMITADILYSIYFDVYEQGGKLYIFMDMLWIASYYLIALGIYYSSVIIENIKNMISKPENI